MGESVEITMDERRWAMLCHLSAFLGYVSGIGFILGPLVFWLLKKEESDFIDNQGKEALNFQLSILLYGIISGILMIILVGIALLLIVGLLQLIFTILAAVKASDGIAYHYPMTIRFVK